MPACIAKSRDTCTYTCMQSGESWSSMIRWTSAATNEVRCILLSSHFIIYMTLYIYIYISIHTNNNAVQALSVLYWRYTGACHLHTVVWCSNHLQWIKMYTGSVCMDSTPNTSKNDHQQHHFVYMCCNLFSIMDSNSMLGLKKSSLGDRILWSSPDCFFYWDQNSPDSTHRYSPTWEHAVSRIPSCNMQEPQIYTQIVWLHSSGSFISDES